MAQRQRTAPPAPPGWLASAGSGLALAGSGWLWHPACFSLGFRLALASGVLFLRISAGFGLSLSLGWLWLRISAGFGFWLSFTRILIGSGLIWLDFNWNWRDFGWI